MTLLDIDLDFFLTAPCPFAEAGARPSDTCALPHSEERVRRFLEQNLGLDRHTKTPGRVFETHDGAVLYWQELVQAGRLSAPFEVVHVDTHSDLGIAQRGYPFVKNSVLCRPVEKRREFENFKAMGQLNEANYLVFALAARLIERLVNLRNTASLPDFPNEMRADAEHIQLKSAFPTLFEAKYGAEPPVRYIEYADGYEFRADKKFDFVSLALSPRYTPRSADCLAEVIAEYISQKA